MKALLFDLDGTLIHSMPLHRRAWQRWYDSVGLGPRDETSFARSAGRSNEEILLDLFPDHTPEQRAAMAEEKEAAYRALAAQELTAVPGAQNFMQEARSMGLQLAVCTAAPLGNIDVAFARFGFLPQVDTVTSPADGLRGKPHPDIFAEAARRLGVAPSQCLVFEDAPLGVEAAARAGMQAVALTTTLAASHFQGFSNLLATAPDFTALELPQLIQASTHRGSHA